jgi:hypothetical protein
MIVVACALGLSATAAHAGPCSNKDAGSGSTPGYTGQTTGTNMAADTKQHPPTDTMNRATGGSPASSQDAQKQMQGQPTAAQEASGAKPEARTADQGC